MDEKQILIRFKTEFKQSVLSAFKTSLSGITRELGNMAKLGGAVAGIGKGILSALNPLKLFSGLFGRITAALIVWQAWRWVKHGFEAIAEAIVGTNAAIQTAVASFASLTGSTEKASKLVAIVRDTAMQTGVAFSDLVFESRRLTTQIGQNETAFQKVTKAAVALSVLDPVQGISGAMFALSGFLEGTAQGARSLAQRFELPFGVLKQAMEDARNPVEALDLAFQRLGIDVDDLIARGRETLPVIFQNLREHARNFLQLLGQPVVQRFTQDLANLRDWLDQNRASIEAIAKALGKLVERIYMAARAIAVGFFPGLGKIINQARPVFEDRKVNLAPTAETSAEDTAAAAAEAQKAAIDAVTEGLQAQERAQKEAIRRLEAWVDDAAKAVQSKRDELNLFNLLVGDIPERFVRGRQRQLELGILAAEREQRHRQEGLDLARQQLQATQDQISAQKELVSALQDTLKEQEDIAKEFDFGADVIDLNAEAGPVAEWAQTWIDAIDKFADKLVQKVAEIGDFLRGFFGKEARKVYDPAMGGLVEAESETYKFGQDVRKIFDGLAETLATMGENLGNWVADLDVIIPSLREIAEFLANLIPDEPGKDVFDGLADNAEKSMREQVSEMESAGTPGLFTRLYEGMAKSIIEGLRGYDEETKEAWKEGVSDPIVKESESLKDKVVGKSIIPEMLEMIRREFQRFPPKLIPALQSLSELLTEAMAAIRLQWAADWREMVETARLSLDQITVMQNRALTAQANLASLGARATAAAPSVQLTGGGGDRDITVTMQLDQDETRRWNEEGQYRAMLHLAENA